jgi:hypothetical protein
MDKNKKAFPLLSALRVEAGGCRVATGQLAVSWLDRLRPRIHKQARLAVR